MPKIPLYLNAAAWFVPLTTNSATLKLRSPSAFVDEGTLQINKSQTAYFVNGEVTFEALPSDELRLKGFADPYYVLLVGGESYEFWLTGPGEPSYDGSPRPGNVPGDLTRLIELVPPGSTNEAPPGVTVSQTVLAQLTQLRAEVAALPDSRGDMRASDYDSDSDGIIDRAAVADSVNWENIEDVPPSFYPAAHAASHAADGTDAIAIETSQISDATATGRAIIKAADAAAGRGAIEAASSEALLMLQNAIVASFGVITDNDNNPIIDKNGVFVTK